MPFTAPIGLEDMPFLSQIAPELLKRLRTLAIKQQLASDVQVDISWISSVLLRLTNADGLVIWHQNQAIGCRGIVKRLQGFASGAEYVLTPVAESGEGSTSKDMSGKGL